MFVCEVTGPGELTINDHRGRTSGWSVELLSGEFHGVVPAHPACAPGLNIGASRTTVEKSEETGPLGTTEGDWKIYYSTPGTGVAAPMLHINGRTFLIFGPRVEIDA